MTDRNVNNNLKFVLKATGWKDERLIDEKINDVLDKVGLKSKGFKMPFEMSGGEQQRVDIARALLNSPKLILADEPTGNLDPETSDEIMQLLIQIAKDYGTTVIMATHDFIVINRYPSRMLKTELGKLIDSEAFKKNFRLIGQVEGSSGSILDNIAEGFGRGGNKEFIQYLSISKASGHEVKSQIYRAMDRNYLVDLGIIVMGLRGEVFVVLRLCVR